MRTTFFRINETERSCAWKRGHTTLSTCDNAGLEHVLNDVHGIGEVGQPEAGEGRIVQSGQGFGQASVIPGQAAKAGGPAETALDDPAAREQHEAAPGLRELDDLQGDPVRTSGFGGIPALVGAQGDQSKTMSYCSCV